MTTPLLTTKLGIPPLRPRLVARPRLIARLNAGLSGRLALISAPAGYGKTTLVTEWLAALAPVSGEGLAASEAAGAKAAWLALDEGDNDPVRFQSYLITAIRQIRPGFGEILSALLQSPQPPPDEIVLAMLVNEIAASPAPLILVLDDYHAVHTPTIHQKLAFLLDHQPAQLHLVLITREDPLLPIARLRARGQVMEIRQDDLRFSLDECADFLQRVMGIPLAGEDVAALERRTEGWIAGLQLAALSMQGRDDLQGFVEAFAGSSRYVLDYLIEEVFERQSAGMQDFLLKTSILDRLTGPLCDAVAERTGSQALLEALEQANLFIVPLDQSRQWYRFHRLFVELLRHRLRAAGDLSEPALHQRASQWYEANGFTADAVHHALAASDWGRAARLIQIVNEAMLKRGEVVTLLAWYRRFPEDVLLSNPLLCFSYCWVLLLAGQFEAAEALLDHVEQAAQDDPAFLGEVAAAQAYLARAQGDHPHMVAMSQRAMALLPKSRVSARGLVAVNLGIAYWHGGQMQAAEQALAEALEAAQATGNHYAALTAVIFQGRVLAVRGQLRQAARTFQQAVQQGGQIPINALAHLDLSMLHYEWNDLEASSKNLQQAIQLCERDKNDEFLLAAWMMSARLRQAQANLGAAGAALEKAHQRIRAGGIPEPTAARLAASQVQFALAQGDLAGAQRWVEQLADNVDSHPFCRFLGLTKARLLLAQNRRPAAEQYLARLYETAVQGGWGYSIIAVRVLQSLAAESPAAALKFLANALVLAQPEGYLRVFAEAGKALAPLLQEAAMRGVAPEYVGQILAAIGVDHKAVSSVQAGLVEPLSERELEVLRLVTAGLSNREIAKKLFVSLGTAKTHIHNICGKLGVRNRTEAAIKAKELKLT